MPSVNSKGEPIGKYNYDIGGGTKPSTDMSKHNSKAHTKPGSPPHSSGNIDTAPHDFPPTGTTGREHRLNVNRFDIRPDQKEVAKVYPKAGWEHAAFDKSGNVKGSPGSKAPTLDSAGSWEVTEGRGPVGSANPNLPKGKTAFKSRFDFKKD